MDFKCHVRDLWVSINNTFSPFITFWETLPESEKMKIVCLISYTEFRALKNATAELKHRVSKYKRNNKYYHLYKKPSLKAKLDSAIQDG